LETFQEIAFAFGIFLVGFACMAVEIFLIPGFGFVGILGAVILVSDVVYAWATIGPVAGLVVLTASLVCTLGSVWLVMRTRLGRRFRLERNLGDARSGASVGREALVGASGVALTNLRPSGVALIGGERIDVVADGEYIEKDRKVRVVQVEGSRIVVEPIDDGRA
jgi:membrane-bound serine protease (ClpP class)